MNMSSLRSGKNAVPSMAVLTYNESYNELHSKTSQFEDCSKSDLVIGPPVKEIKKRYRKRKCEPYHHLETEPYYQFYSTEKTSTDKRNKSELKPKCIRKRKPTKPTRKTSRKLGDPVNVTPSKLSLFKQSKEQKTTKLTQSTSSRFRDLNRLTPSKWCSFKSKVRSISNLFVRNSIMEVEKYMQPERLAEDKKRPPVPPRYSRDKRRHVQNIEKLTDPQQSIYYAQAERQLPCSMSPKCLREETYIPSTRKEYRYPSLSLSSDRYSRMYAKQPKNVLTKTNLLQSQNENKISKSCISYKEPSSPCPYCRNGFNYPFLHENKEIVCNNLSLAYLNDLFHDVEKKYLPECRQGGNECCRHKFLSFETESQESQEPLKPHEQENGRNAYLQTTSELVAVTTDTDTNTTSSEFEPPSSKKPSVICTCNKNCKKMTTAVSSSEPLLPAEQSPEKCTYNKCCGSPNKTTATISTPLPTDFEHVTKKPQKHVATSVHCLCSKGMNVERPPSATPSMRITRKLDKDLNRNHMETQTNSMHFQQTAKATDQHQLPHDLVTQAVKNKYNGEILCIHSPPCVLINGCINIPNKTGLNLNHMETQTNSMYFQQTAKATDQHQLPHDLVTQAVQNKYNGEILCIHSPPCVLINGCLNLPNKNKTSEVQVYTARTSKMASLFRKLCSKSRLKMNYENCQNESPYCGVQECQTSNTTVDKQTSSIHHQHHDLSCPYIKSCSGPNMENIYICNSCIRLPLCSSIKENPTRQLLVEKSYINHANKYDVTKTATSQTEERESRFIALTAKEDICTQVSKKYIPAQDLCVHVPICNKEITPVCCVQNDMIQFPRAESEINTICESEISIGFTEYFDFPRRDTNNVGTLTRNYNPNQRNYLNASEYAGTYSKSIKKDRKDLKELDTILEVRPVSRSNLSDNFTTMDMQKKENGILAKFSQEKADDRYCVHVPMCRKVPKCLAKAKLKKEKQTKKSKKTKDQQETNVAYHDKKYYVTLTPREDFCIQVATKENTTNKPAYVCRHQPPCVKIPECLGEVLKDGLIPLEDIPDCKHFPFCELIPACCRKRKENVQSVASQFPASCRIS